MENTGQEMGGTACPTQYMLAGHGLALVSKIEGVKIFGLRVY